MTLHLYNTLTRKKEPFRPLDPARVRMYVCGPTVYDFAHIGNARPVIVFDALFRLLRHAYGPGHVAYARNITDVDDKIISRAAEECIPIEMLTERTARQFHADVAALGCLPPTVEPRATEHIPQMVAMIARLIASGHAYEAEGHVLFDVPSMQDYGRLSGRSVDEMIAGARVEVAPYKRDPMDFVLWKPSGDADPGWPSPWGRGRPGWHIECSAMAAEHLGETFDIHGGGIDLVFPHHENEIAQSTCAHDTNIMAQVWMHNGYLQVEGEKMSKSLGNFVTVRQLLNAWPGAAVRFGMLTTHYRQPFNWTGAKIEDAKEELESWAERILEHGQEGAARLANGQAASAKPSPDLIEALFDDLNTPNALVALRKLAEAARKGDAEAARQLMIDADFLGLLHEDNLAAHLPGVSSIGAVSADILFEHIGLAERMKIALLNREPHAYEALGRQLVAAGLRAENEKGRIELTQLDDFKASQSGLIDEKIDQRNAARRAKNFAEADRIRDELTAMGIALKDGPDGTTWEVAR